MTQQEEPALAKLDLIQEAIKGGNAVLVLGANVRVRSKNVPGGHVPTYDEFFHLLCDTHNISSNERETLTLDDLIDYSRRTTDAKKDLDELIKQAYSVKISNSVYAAITALPWHRIYSFDVSDALELAYRQNPNRAQTPAFRLLANPVSADVDISSTIEIIKMFGSVVHPNMEMYVNTPRFSERWSRSSWHDSFLKDIEIKPTVFCGETGDAIFLVNYYRKTKSEITSKKNVTFIVPDLTSIQAQTLEQDSVLVLKTSSETFFGALAKLFPAGRTIEQILEETSGLSIKANKQLTTCLLNDFQIFTRSTIEDLRKERIEPKGGIRRFYRGDEVTWTDIIDNIYADLTPYRNFRNRIELALTNKDIFAGLFILTSAAGMGKTIGLMSTAIWLRNFTNIPILLFKPEGNLNEFLGCISDDDFCDGVFLLIDDITLYFDAFDKLRESTLKKFCIIATSRETRWFRYGSRFTNRFSIKQDTIRKLNNADAEALRDRMSQFGTMANLRSADRGKQIREILERSGRDLLVLIKELGQGEQFDKIVRSEVDDLSPSQRFAYFLVCLTLHDSGGLEGAFAFWPYPPPDLGGPFRLV